MVPIKKGQKVPESNILFVVAENGEYADTDLILCGEEGGEASGMYSAQYIQYGPMVYQFNLPEELGAAIVAIDKDSTHDAAILYQEDEARKISRQKGTLLPENGVPAPDALVPEAVDESKRVEKRKAKPIQEEQVKAPVLEEVPLPIENPPLEQTPSALEPMESTEVPLTPETQRGARAIDVSATTQE